MFITISDFIIALIVVSFSAAIIVGTLVYCILNKKHENDMDWLFNTICNNQTDVYRFYNKYADHIASFHTSEDYDE